MDPGYSSGADSPASDLDLPAADANSPSSPPTPPPKRSRRTVQKHIVSVPLADVHVPADAARHKNATGEALTPPPDQWTWRKYGQKPIKGSPYPRGYYRCSSSKGCPARKQVERSRADPAMLVVTYSFEHNHSSPAPRRQPHKPAAVAPAQDLMSPETPDQEDQDHKFNASPADNSQADLVMPAVAEDPFHWFDDVGSPDTSGSTVVGSEGLFLCATVMGAGDVSWLEMDSGSCGEDDAMFAGLGELPECSVVFRRAAGLGVAPAWRGAAGTTG